jgi:hypothetical protein
MDHVEPGYEGLYAQLSWTANNVNRGFYGRQEGGLKAFDVGEDVRVSIARDINAGTVALQFMLAAHSSVTYEAWMQDISPTGFFATYNHLYGNPFAYTVDPLWPPTLVQPDLSLPWPRGETWYFTGGPHGGWASGSAWAALDFAPRQGDTACYISDQWVTSMSDGLVARSSYGAVVVDLDGDGYPGTGWAITYMHLDHRDRVAVGTLVKNGDPIGHPSCEGGYVSATHLHIARSYNGRWVSADGITPFQIGGWESVGLGQEYDGLFIRGDIVKEACDCMAEGNAITAE